MPKPPRKRKSPILEAIDKEMEAVNSIGEEGASASLPNNAPLSIGGELGDEASVGHDTEETRAAI